MGGGATALFATCRLLPQFAFGVGAVESIGGAAGEYSNTDMVNRSMCAWCELVFGLRRHSHAVGE